MGEFIHNIQEKIETVIGEVLESRQKSIVNFTGLGPPDLCVLVKSYEPPRFVPGLKAQKVSSYHWVVGVDTSSTSSIAVYLGTLIDNQERSSFGRGQYKIEGCHFVCYNAFLKMDLHVEIGINNNTAPTVYSVGANQERNSVEELFWKECYISSVLRSLQTSPPMYLRPVKILPTLRDPREESNFLQLCSQHFWQGRKLGGFDSEFIDVKNQPVEGMEIDDSNNLLVTTLSNYFTRRNRYQPMVAFFEEFKKTEPSVCVPISMAYSAMGNINEAMELLESSLALSPDSTSILLELAVTLVYQAKKEQLLKTDKAQQFLLHGLQLSLKAIALRPQLIKAWRTAATVLSQMGAIEWALVFMNNAPMVKQDHLTDRIGKASYSRVTPPPDHPNMVTILEDEELEFDEEPGEEFLKCLTSASLTGDSLTYFEMLITIYKRIGWIPLAEKKTKILDPLANLVRSRQRRENSPNQPHRTANGGSTTGGATVVVGGEGTKDAHNSMISSSNKTQATENTNTDTDTGTSEQPQIPESTVPKEVLWRDEDVTSEGSDIEDEDNVKEDENKEKEEQTTTQPVQVVAAPVKPDRPAFDSKSIQLDNLNTTLSEFIDQFGVDSLLDKQNKEYLTFEENHHFNAKLPAININKNLDLAFHALFQDVKAFQAWKEEEESKKSLETTHTNLTMKQLHATRSISDWIRLGMLSYRLGELGDAEKIFRIVFDDRFQPKALLGLIKVFTDHGDIRNCLMSSSTICRYYNDKIKVKEMHPTIEKSILNLIATYGLQKVRNIHATIQDLDSHIGSLYLDSVKWRSFGYDR
eukprot:gene6276-7819_t